MVLKLSMYRILAIMMIVSVGCTMHSMKNDIDEKRVIEAYAMVKVLNTCKTVDELAAMYTLFARKATSTVMDLAMLTDDIIHFKNAYAIVPPEKRYHFNYIFLDPKVPQEVKKTVYNFSKTIESLSREEVLLRTQETFNEDLYTRFKERFDQERMLIKMSPMLLQQYPIVDSPEEYIGHERDIIEAHGVLLALNESGTTDELIRRLRLVAQGSPSTLMNLVKFTADNTPEGESLFEYAYTILPQKNKEILFFELFKDYVPQGLKDSLYKRCTQIDGMNGEELRHAKDNLQKYLDEAHSEKRALQKWALISQSPALMQEEKELQAIPVVDVQTPFHGGYGQEGGIGYSNPLAEVNVENQRKLGYWDNRKGLQ